MMYLKMIQTVELVVVVRLFESVHGLISETCPRFVTELIYWTRKCLQDPELFISETGENPRSGNRTGDLAGAIGKLYSSGKIPASLQCRLNELETRLNLSADMGSYQNEVRNELVKGIIDAVVNSEYPDRLDEKLLPSPSVSVPDDRPIAFSTLKKAKQRIGWDLFSGIGGVKCGMTLAGIKPVLGVELDPRDRKLSEAFIEIHLMNGWQGTRLETVQEFADWGCPGLPRNADIAHISPVCADYSAATNGAPRNENQAMIRASMDAIAIGMPRCFTLEQVPMYRKSPEFEYMKARAIALGYTVNSTVLNIGAAFGQSRRRLIVTAALNANWESPIQPASRDWYEVVEDLIPAFDPIVPTPRQRQAAIDWQARNPDEFEIPLYVERVTCGKKPKARGRSELTPTLMKSKFRDGADNGRSKVSCLYIPSTGDWLNLNLEAYARLSGFPDTFRYLNRPIVGAGFGYSVPPLFYASLLKSMPK